MFVGVGSVKVLKIEEMLEVQDVDEEIFGDLKNNQKNQMSDEHEKSERSRNIVSEGEESEEEYRIRTGQEP